jgi:hypothetical protein
MGARQFELWTLIVSPPCIEMVVSAGIGIKVTLATNFKVGSIRPDMSIFQKSCSPEETSSLVCNVNNRAEHIQHGKSGITTAESCHRAEPEDPDLERRGFLQKSPHS